MTLSAGSHVGPYEIIAPLGAGGMGEVYRARDTKLGRDVAIKILLNAVGNDPERIARFEREAKMLAALNHPHIAHIHGFEDSTGTPALVMELVEGPTLADLIAKGPLGLDESLGIAGQIAEALEAAHEQGIIHRDLKPSNIKVRDDGTVKILDFGLAKALDPVGSGNAYVSVSPTITSPAMMTNAGMILGTAAYMSPEQAKGKPADKRSDIWAFGCVLYEMLTARRPFPGDDISEVLASILAREPDFGTLPATLPPPIRRLLRRCLQKDPTQRLRDIGDARIEIRDALAKGSAEGTIVPAPVADTRHLRWVGLVSAVALLALMVAIAAMWRGRSGSPPPEMHLEITTPATSVPAALAISPDGRAIVFVANADGRPRLWLRMLDSTAARPLAGTDGADSPFWSPNSRSVGFFADERVKRVDIDNGSTRTLAKVYRGTGGTWSRDGVILVSSLGAPISRLPDTGGEPIELSRLFKQGSDFSPKFLPDGRHFLYRVRGTAEADGVYLGDLDGKLDARRVVDSARDAVYLPSGYLLFVRQRTLLAQRFDLDRLQFIGSSFRVTEDSTDCDCAGLSVSDTGLIAYRTTAPARQRQFVWFDRSGKPMGTVGDLRAFSSPSLSPDGQRVAGYRGNPVDGNLDVWTLDVPRGTYNRLTDDPADDTNPIWSPNGERIVFGSNRSGTADLYRKPAVASGSEELLLATPEHKIPTDWSSDGRFILFGSRNPKTGSDIWALPLDKDGKPGKPFPVVNGDFEEQRGQFSPDGHWIAYQSDESGRHEIYLRAFPGPGFKRPVSTNGGTEVRWARSGEELFYVALDGRLMRVPVRLRSNAEPEVDTPVVLFAPPLGGPWQQSDFRHQYMVSPDGQRFLVATVAEGAADGPIVVVLNWKPRQ